MDKLYHHVLATDPTIMDMLYARELAATVAACQEKPPGLTSQMWDSAQRCAFLFLYDGQWWDHLFLCLLLMQRRTPDMSPEEIAGRLELESLFMEELYGNWTEDGTPS